MKKSFKNFLIVTIVISVVAAFGLELLEYLLGPVQLFFGAVITVILGFIYVVYMQIRSRINKNR